MERSTMILEIDREIVRLTKVRNLILDGQPADSAQPKRRTMSSAARKRIGAAQKARWAKLKRAGS
jgi:hypothetical protein